jgi:hypothetical protein
MSRRGTRRKNWATLFVLLIVLLAALAIVVIEFADPATKGDSLRLAAGTPVGRASQSLT